MARTPLLSRLRRLFREHRAARAAGLPPDAVREERSRLPRRAFLAGAAAAAATLPACAAQLRTSPSIAIVGAGVAGLTCALTLRDLGFASTVYEASGRVGGRMFSRLQGWADGQISEWGGELIDSGHRTIRKLAQRFGLPLDAVLKAQPKNAEDTYYFLQRYYPQADADRDFAPVFARLEADLAAAGYPTTYDAFTPAGRELDRMSVRRWIETRVPGGTDAPLGRLLDVAYTLEYGADSREQSALNLLYLLAYQPKPNTLSVFGESDEAFHIRGGNEQLPRAIAAELGEDAVVTGRRLERLRRTSGNRYRLSFGHGAEVVADWVVLALPFAVLRGIDTRDAGFDARKRRAIQELGRGLNAKTQLQFKKRLWNAAGPWPGVSSGGSYADTGYQASWDATRAQPGTSGILVFYLGGSPAAALRATTAFAAQADADVRADAVDTLHRAEPVFPGLSAAWNERATQSLPHLSPFFQNSYAYYKPGQYTDFGGYEKESQGGVLFCGEHTSGDYQGFMEGGASEGERAGRQLARLIG